MSIRNLIKQSVLGQQKTPPRSTNEAKPEAKPDEAINVVEAPPPAKRSPVLKGLEHIDSWLKTECDLVLAQQVSEKSKEQYRRNGMRFDGSRVAGEAVSLAEHEGRSSTFYAYRASVRFYAAEFGKAALRDYEKARRAKDAPAKAAAYQRMLDAAADLKLYSRDVAPGLPNPKAVALGLEDPKPEGSPARAKRENKKTVPPRETSKLKAANAIAKKYPDWRVRIWERLQKIKSPWLEHAAIAALTGARPDEVRFAEIKKTGKALVIKVYGAKLSKNSGQEWREFTLKDDKSGEFAHLFSVASTTLKTVGVPDGVTDYPDAFSVALARAGAQVLPKTDRFSAYVYRHALASDLKADGAQREQIAAALGHAVTKTQDAYGRASGGRAGARSLSVTCAREIKQTHDTRFTNPQPVEPSLVSVDTTQMDGSTAANIFNTPNFGDFGL